MSRLCFAVHLMITISFLTEAVYTCNKETIQSSVTNYVRNLYPRAGEDDIELFTSCSVHASNGDGTYILSKAVISYSIPNLVDLEHNSNNGVSGRLNIECRQATYPGIKPSFLPAITREPSSQHCKDCLTSRRDPCVACEIRCGPGLIVNPECSACVKNTFRTQIVSESKPNRDGIYTTKGHFVGVSDHSTKGHFVSTASRQPDNDEELTSTTPENQITTMKEEPTTPNVLTTEVNMTAFTEGAGTRIRPETVNPAVTSTKPDVFTTRSNGTSPITEGWSSPHYNASEFILVTLPRGTLSPPNDGDESRNDGDSDEDDSDDGGREPEYKYPTDNERNKDREDDDDDKDNSVVVITEQPSDTPCQSAIECLNFGRPVCQNGLFEYCLCRTEFKGMYCEVSRTTAITDTKVSFWDWTRNWSLFESIAAGLGVVFLVGLVLLVTLLVRCARDSRKERRDRERRDAEAAFLPTPVVLPVAGSTAAQHLGGSGSGIQMSTLDRGSSAHLDTRSEEEFPLHELDGTLPRHHDQPLRRSYPDPEDDGLVHHSPTGRPTMPNKKQLHGYQNGAIVVPVAGGPRHSPEHYNVPKPREYINMDKSTAGGYKTPNGYHGNSNNSPNGYHGNSNNSPNGYHGNTPDKPQQQQIISPYMNASSNNTYSHKLLPHDSYAQLDSAASHNYLNLP